MQKIALPDGVEITLTDDGLFEVAVATDDQWSELTVRTSNGFTSIAARLVRFPLPAEGETIEVVYHRRRFGRITRSWRTAFTMTSEGLEETPQS